MRVFIGLMLVLGSWVTVFPAQAQCGRLTIAEMSWASAAIAAHVEKIILEKGFGCRAELVPGDTVPTMTSMAERGEPDIAPELWINTVRDIIERSVAEGRLKIASRILKDGGEDGWYVPKYLVEKHPELATLPGVLKRPDLFPDPEAPGKGRFYTCPSGWACQIVNDNLFRAYDMAAAGFVRFDPGSGEGLAAAIAKANERREPIFTYYFGPTAILGRYPMVKLSGMPHDPKTWDCIAKPDCPDPMPNGYAPGEVIGVVTAKFALRAPEVFAFLQKVAWDNAAVNGILAWQDEERARADEAAEHFLKTREDVWTEWVAPDVADKVKKAVR